ncbi:MAG: nicotinate-nucleotide--dimethylbenzimidazole phosphoribosyltransferase [Blautia sp.]|nr:nicotinate-nucleotide--dimethylbenzimidazole phosphoribosyltransferase [Blautia sp.]
MADQFHGILEDAVARIAPPDREAMHLARKHLDGLIKPAGSLGDLEIIGERIAGMTGNVINHVDKKVHFLFGADNGVYDEGVSGTPQHFTGMLMRLYAGRRGCCIDTFCKKAEVDLRLFDLGIKNMTPCPGIDSSHRLMPDGTGNIVRERAMPPETTRMAVEFGITLVRDAVKDGYRLFGTGEVGMGNTTTATACIMACLGRTDESLVGRGGGLTDEAFAKKKDVIARALALHGLGSVGATPDAATGDVANHIGTDGHSPSIDSGGISHDSVTDGHILSIDAGGISHDSVTGGHALSIDASGISHCCVTDGHALSIDVGGTTHDSFTDGHILNIDAGGTTHDSFTDGHILNIDAGGTTPSGASSCGSASPLEILSCVGGLDIAAMTGVFIGAAAYRVPVVVDGMIAASAALLAERFAPGTRAYMFGSHNSTEPAFMAAAQELGLSPLLNLRLRVGEGTGCPLAMQIIEDALYAMNNMASFKEEALEDNYRSELKF